MITRGQLLIWDMGSSRDYHTPHDQRRNFAGVGVAEVDEGYDEHVMRSFVCHQAGDDLALSITDYSRNVAPEVEAHEFGSIVTQPIWPRPDARLGLPGGGLVFRRTRLPAESGREAMLVCLVGSFTPGTLHHNHFYSLTGSIGRWASDEPAWSSPGRLDLKDPIDVSGKLAPGMSLSQLLKCPLWGWGPDPVAFISTLDLPTIDACNRYDLLTSKPNPTAAEAKEIETLRRSPAGGILETGRNDNQYRIFREHMIAAAGHLPWDGVQTDREQKQRASIANMIIRDLLEVDELA